MEIFYEYYLWDISIMNYIFLGKCEFYGYKDNLFILRKYYT